MSRLVRDAVPLSPKPPAEPEPKPNPLPKRCYPIGFHEEVAARRQGERAAWYGEPIHACPHTALPLVAAWRNGWSEARAHRRAAEQARYEQATQSTDRPTL